MISQTSLYPPIINTPSSVFLLLPLVLMYLYSIILKKVGNTTRPFRYNLNQIPYDYTVEVRNRFKGLNLIDRVPDELWTEVRDTVQKIGSKTIPQKRNAKK